MLVHTSSFTGFDIILTPPTPCLRLPVLIEWYRAACLRLTCCSTLAQWRHLFNTTVPSQRRDFVARGPYVSDIATPNLLACITDRDTYFLLDVRIVSKCYDSRFSTLAAGTERVVPHTLGRRWTYSYVRSGRPAIGSPLCLAIPFAPSTGVVAT